MRPWIAMSLLACMACGQPQADETSSESQLSNLAFPDDRSGLYPIRPDLSMTPGSLCQEPDSLRYPEQIPYCRRAVAKTTKVNIIKTYDTELNYQVGQLDRSDFKIDHMVPLCMGGSNKRDNLWPQHRSVYEVTDKLEQRLCEALAKAAITQKEAVSIIRDLKQELEKAPEVNEICDEMIGDSE